MPDHAKIIDRPPNGTTGNQKKNDSRRSARTPASMAARSAKPSIKRERAAKPDDVKSSVLTVRVKDRLKADATAVLAEIGISLPEAVRVFLSRVVSEGGFPFRLEVPNAITRAAMEEARNIGGRFATAQELFDDLENGGVR